ncbi:ATP-binding cassette domain-containing protein [Paenibacillus sp. HJL G12]|uniref:ATP-binding cassette domain-containing protein n=1 Tax=Paenibacillus dendrobii TaxID=2691084 RepID=A0A7X3ILW9_9BACL|nr:ABC transporter ATP-binding protein [Paenibacillus dendrobii]MWV46015.1 ATP-binding cassette domain-containing protein [Paenibacillus dendrobii]
MNPKIHIRHLNKSYGTKQALQDINLDIETGMFGLLGRNGAGKTTLMKTLATLHMKNSGDVTVCGIPIEKAKEVRRCVGYLPQDFAVYPNMTVYGAMDYLGTLSGLPTSIRRERIPQLLRQVNLEDRHRMKFKALSGGMKRRLGIAQAILHDPEVLIVDEPTAGLDPEERIRFRNLLSELAEDRIVILSTHIVGDIEATCERIAVLDQGQLKYTGTAQELTAKAAGKVYTVNMSKQELERVKAVYTVTAMLTLGNEVTVRLLADRMPYPNAVPAEPTIEDAYMLMMGGHSDVRSSMA